MFPDNVFLEIFDFCLCDEPAMFSIQRTEEWQALVHVCQRWRQIIFASPCRLALHLNCTFGTPVRTSLSFWPVTLPLTIDYPGPPFDLDSHRLLEDHDNIVAALEHPSRVHGIVIHTAPSLLSETITIMRMPFPALKHLDLEWYFADPPKATRSSYPRGLPIPGDFLGGSSPLLQHLRFKHISFPQLPMLLLSAPNLITLELKSISENDYIPTEAIVTSLAALTRLETLSITFYEYEDMSPPDQNESQLDLPMRIILPTLTSFRYRGYCIYLEDFLVQINTPRLDNLRVEYFPHQIEASQLSQFIDRTPNIKLNRFRNAEVMFCPIGFGIEFDCPQECRQAQFSLSIFEFPLLHEQVPCMTNVLGQLVPTFPNVDHLSSGGNNFEPRKMESADWLPFFRLFQAVKALHLSGGVAAYIVSALEEATDEMVAEVFPALDLIWLDDEGSEGIMEGNEPAGSIERFLSLRQLSGRPVTVVDTEDAFFEADRNPL